MEGTPIYTVTDIDITEIGSDLEGNPIHAHICYVKNADGTEAKYAEHTISDLSARTEHNALMVDITKVLTIGDIMGDSDKTSNIMEALKDWKIKDLSDQAKINGLTLGNILVIDETDPTTSKIMIALKNKTLGDLTKQETIDDLQLKDVLDLDNSDSKLMDALKNKKISDLAKQETINELQLGQILDIDETNPNTSKIMIALKETSLAELTNQATINSLYLSDILTIDANSPAMLQALQGFSISDLNNPDKINDLNLGTLLGTSNSSTPLLKKISEWSLGELTGASTDGKSKIDDLKLSDVMIIDEKSPIALQNLKDATVTNLGDAFSELTLGQMIDDVESNTFLKHLSDSTVSTLSADLETLTIQQVFMDQIYLMDSDAYFTDKDGNSLGYNSIDVVKTNSNYKVYAVRVIDGKEHYLTTSGQILYGKDNTFYTDEEMTQAYNGTRLESQAVLTGTWKYLLMNNGQEQICQLTQMTNLITNMTSSIQTASLNDLSKDGLIELDEATLNTPITKELDLMIKKFTFVKESDSYYEKSYLGELTVQELFNYVGKILTAINE